MNIFKAVAGFTPSEDTDNQETNVLGFEKGDEFDVLDVCQEYSWFGARALKDGAIGFIPANFFKKKQLPLEEVLVEEDPDILSARELHLQTLAELQRKENFRHPGCVYPEMIPEPDYSDSDDDSTKPKGNTKATLNGHLTDDGLIVPKKLSNPCVESKDRQNLHKELMFNQKIGKNVLNQKSELQKVMDKFQDEHKKKELEQDQLTRRTSLEKKLVEQANKLKVNDEPELPKKSADIPEFLRVHAKVRARMDSQ